MAVRAGKGNQTIKETSEAKQNGILSTYGKGIFLFVGWFVRFSAALTTTVLGAKYIDELFVSLEKARNKNKVSGLSCSSGG